MYMCIYNASHKPCMNLANHSNSRQEQKNVHTHTHTETTPSSKKSQWASMVRSISKRTCEASALPIKFQKYRLSNCNNDTSYPNLHRHDPPRIFTPAVPSPYSPFVASPSPYTPFVASPPPCTPCVTLPLLPPSSPRLDAEVEAATVRGR